MKMRNEKQFWEALENGCCALFPQDPPGSPGVNIARGSCMVLLGIPCDTLGPQSQHCRSWSGHVMLHKVKWELYRGGCAAASAKFGTVILCPVCSHFGGVAYL